MQVLKDAKRLGIQNIWIQPGGEDQEVIQFSKENTDLNVILGGPCLLVDGPSLLQTYRNKGRL